MTDWYVLRDYGGLQSGRWKHAWGTQFPDPASAPAHPGAEFYRLDLGITYTWDGAAWNPVAAGGATIIVKEVDGGPSGAADTLAFDQTDGFVLSDLGGGDMRVDLAGVPEAVFGFTDVLTANADTSKHGLMQKYPGGTTNFLRADGTFAAPPGAPGGGATFLDVAKWGPM